MPNYVKNVIQLGQSVPQDRIEALYKAVLNTHPVTGEGEWFDFNTLIPMPKDLDIESGSNNEIVMLLYRLMQKGSAKPNGFIQRILDAQGCWDVFSKDNLQTVTREYRAYSKEIHPDVCKDARITYKGYNLDITAFENCSAEAYAMYVECWDANECLYQDEKGVWHGYDCDSCPHPC